MLTYNQFENLRLENFNFSMFNPVADCAASRLMTAHGAGPNTKHLFCARQGGFLRRSKTRPPRGINTSSSGAMTCFLFGKMSESIRGQNTETRHVITGGEKADNFDQHIIERERS